MDSGVPRPTLHGPAESLRGCSGLQSSGAVNTIFGAVDRLNALPLPVSAPCFVASLPRPLEVVATLSPISAQPGAGRRSPRVFLLNPGLVVSVAHEGAGARLIEFAEWTEAKRTLKGELEVPIGSRLTHMAPLEHIQRPTGVTTCGVCHRNESAHPAIDGGFVSEAYRPDPTTNVPLTEVAALHDACDEADTSDRCLLLHALFDFGELRQGAFSRSLSLFAP